MSSYIHYNKMHFFTEDCASVNICLDTIAVLILSYICFILNDDQVTAIIHVHVNYVNTTLQKKYPKDVA
jgi:hypothetical protein